LKKDKPWYTEWFDENYLEVYRHRNTDDAKKQVRLLIDTLKPPPHTAILDLGCGEGRYTAILEKHGFRVLGIDLSDTLVKYGKKKHPHLNLAVGDMRFIPGCFDLILSLFTSFGYFEKDEENKQVIRSVYYSLNPNGIYWLDFLNADCVAKNLIPNSLTRLASGINVSEKRKIENGRIIKDIHFKKNNMEKCYKESVRLFTRHDLEQMFQESGFRVMYCFGDYKGNTWSPESERTILVGKKQGAASE
jgi:SAM-dependent methyltransferase